MKKILVVEDNEKNAKLLRDILTIKGYQVIEAADGETGVSLCLEERPDLVLMDIHLPGISGVDALLQLRADERTRATRVVAVTASVMDQDRAQIVAAGFDGFISKPINLKEFLAVVAREVGPGDT